MPLCSSRRRDSFFYSLRSSNIYIKPAGEPNTFDVFLGTGWTNWSRVKVKDDGVPVSIKGIQLNHHFLSHLQALVNTIFYSDIRSKKRK